MDLSHLNTPIQIPLDTFVPTNDNPKLITIQVPREYAFLGNFHHFYDALEFLKKQDKFDLENFEKLEMHKRIQNNQKLYHVFVHILISLELGKRHLSNKVEKPNGTKIEKGSLFGLFVDGVNAGLRAKRSGDVLIFKEGETNLSHQLYRATENQNRNLVAQIKYQLDEFRKKNANYKLDTETIQDFLQFVVKTRVRPLGKADESAPSRKRKTETRGRGRPKNGESIVEEVSDSNKKICYELLEILKKIEFKPDETPKSNPVFETNKQTSSVDLASFTTFLEREESVMNENYMMNGYPSELEYGSQSECSEQELESANSMVDYLSNNDAHLACFPSEDEQIDPEAYKGYHVGNILMDTISFDDGEISKSQYVSTNTGDMPVDDSRE